MKYLHLIRRSWGLILLTVIWILVSQRHEAFDALGPLVFVISMCFLVAVLQRLVVTANFSHTIDKDAIEPRATKRSRFGFDWDDLEPHQRVYATVAVKIGYIIAFAIIAAGVGK